MFLSFPPPTKMFQFRGLAHPKVWHDSIVPGCPIRTSADQLVFANPRGFSQLTSFGTAFAHVTVTAHHDGLSGKHHVKSTLDTVGQTVAASVHIVEFALGHRVIHVDGGEKQFALFGHLFEAVHSCGGFFGNASDFGGHFVPVLRIFGKDFFQKCVDDLKFRHIGVQRDKGGNRKANQVAQVDSSAVDKINYNPETKDLNVTYAGNPKEYLYPNVPKKVVQAFLMSPSKGAFANKVISRYSDYSNPRVQQKIREGN